MSREPATFRDDFAADRGFQEQINQLIHLAALLAVTPIAIYRWREGDSTLATILSAGCLYLVAALVFGWSRKYYTVSGAVLLVLMSVAAIYATTFIGLLGLAWVFPLVLGIFFIFEHVLALVFGIAVVLLASLAAIIGQVDNAVLLRLTVSLLLCVGLSFIFANQVAQQRRQLVKLAVTDGLTQCYNRTELSRVLRNMTAMNHRYRQTASIIMIDLDRFKPINDSLGHLVGDQILLEFAELLSSRLRRTDALFRYGGEEFVVLLPETPLDKAKLVAESLREAVEKHRFAGVSRITMSAGVTELQADEEWGKWLDRSDTLMYRAKRAGRNRVASD